MSEAFDVIAIGDTTQDIFLQMSDAKVECDKDDKNCRISFDFADKIAVEKKTDVPAVGNAANHAVGMARLGLRSSIYTIVGDDQQGKLSEEVFKKDGVDTTYLTFDKEHGTNLSIVINFKGERTIFVYHEPRSYQIPDLATTEWIYLTSASGDGVKELHAQVLELLGGNPDMKMAFNPGTHQMHLGLGELTPLLAKSDLLFLNREEAAQVLGTKERGVAELAKQYHAIGVKTLVMTDGPDGSYVSDGNKIHFLPVFQGPVVERTGTGDAFGVGFLAATIKGKGAAEAMLWGNADATSVLQQIGAQAGLLDELALERMIADNSTIRVEEFND